MRLRALPVLFFGSLLGIFFAAPRITQAQSTATINGTLTDPSGASIAGAEVTARLLDSTAKPISGQSGPEGKFTLSVPPGEYRVTIEHASFERQEEEFTVAAGEARTWDARLALEKMSSTVVVSATAEPTTAEETPVPVNVISKADIAQRQEIFGVPMLTTTPGISMSRTGAYGGITTFFLDGGNSSSAKVIIDGTAVNDPGNEEDYSYLTLENIEKIEVVHGASSVLFGSDAMTGVVQIFTHRGETRKPQITLEGEGGTFNTGHGGGQMSGVLGAFDYSAAGSYFSTSGQGPDDAFRDTTLSGNFGYHFSDSDRIRLAIRNNSSNGQQPGQTLLGPPAEGQSIGLQNFSTNFGWDFKTGEHWQNHLEGFESRNVQTVVDPPFGTFISKFNRAGLDARTSYLFRGGTFTAGYEWEVENGPSEGRHNQAGYLEAQYQFTSRFSAVAGGRVEGNGKYGTWVVPRVGGVYLLRKGDEMWGATRLRASYGQGIKEPALLPVDCSPNLLPERSRTVDAGIEQSFSSDRMRVAVTYFYNKFQNIVSFDFTTPTPNCPAFGGSFFNTDLARATGVNAEFEAKPLRWLRITGNYSYDNSKVLASPNAFDPALEAGNRLFKRPLNMANVVFNATLWRMNWNFSGNYVGRRTDSDFLGLGITSNPSYVCWNLAAIIPLRYGLSATARVENLFNNHYQDAIGYPALRLHYLLGMKYVWGRG